MFQTSVTAAFETDASTGEDVLLIIHNYILNSHTSACVNRQRILVLLTLPQNTLVSTVSQDNTCMPNNRFHVNSYFKNASINYDLGTAVLVRYQYSLQIS